MQTLNSTPHQTITANAKKLHELAAWYAETGAAEHLEHAKTGNAGHKGNALACGENATQLEKLALALEDFLLNRRITTAAPAIDKAGQR